MEAEPRSTEQPVPTMSWEMLEKSLAHPNAVIREKAMETAGRFSDARAIAALQSAVRDENPRFRAAAAQALAHACTRRHPETDTALATLIAVGMDDELRRFLIANGATSGSPTLLRTVIECLVDASPAIRTAAEAALKEQAGNWPLSPAAVEAAPVIESALSSPDPQVRAAAGTWNEVLCRAQVRHTMLDTGIATILTLTASLRGPSAVLRAGAAWALQGTGDARAMPPLVDALRDPEEKVRRAAATALGARHWQAATEEEAAGQLVALGRWSAAVALGSAAVDALLLAARHSSPATQARAIECLGELKSVRTILPLQELLPSPHAPVRRAAAHALEALEWVPTTNAQAVAHAIELENWPAAVVLGTAAIPALMAALKASRAQPARAAQIAGALAEIADAEAAPSLLPCCRDGEVAQAATRALQGLLERHVEEIDAGVLTEIAALHNLVQFEFSIDPQYQEPVRSGMEFVNIDDLRAAALAELARRPAASADEKEPS